MRILIAAAGRASRAGAETALVTGYLKNAAAHGARLGFGAMALREVEDRRSRPDATEAAQRKQREGELLLAQAPQGAVLVALDGRGGEMSSENFAAWLAQSRDQGCRDMVFFIGGADGLSDALLTQAHKRLSLGAMTWPHMLARIMLAEQIYRAVTILANHPYHRG
ncbi:MAG: 23S rRNA (pseudouridine1915-N3)-methyltransferase [Alphaproteobacteria bacterium]|nr:23S rRNA (pseudouridine1915-N3)-methyltransferase [Alphaproteobacteria bacterium]